MGRYVQSFLSSNVLGSFSDQFQSTQSIAVPSSSQLVASSTQLVAQPIPKSKPTVGSAWIPQELRDLDPCSTQPVPLPSSKRQKLTDSSTIRTQSAHNKFTEIRSMFIPSPLRRWDTAHEHLKKLWPFLEQPKLDYVVPDISMFFDTQQNLRTTLVLMWLRVRPIILWKLGSPGSTGTSFYSNKEWRGMLEYMTGTYSLGESSRMGSKRKKMGVVLTELIARSKVDGVRLETDNLGEAPPRWNGLVLNESKLLVTVVREILWELNELSFRYELLALDRKLIPELQGDGREDDEQRTEWQNREDLIANCWPGPIFQVRTKYPGLSANTDVSQRRGG
ncbi:hypothetical protein BT96DRAFT_946157 [Gymnopus androsaceus JB14]|uniref:Uncharacterized protein n=1 Tax=Gymnopus androsaceus JB14 TaxID=1447944 RepID=A0A6A4GY89_9AGAR|nr:hypothetical protein BT96DRAFT_946157 [Gymnopus androsaceus JB14]